jgi:hypothetical protein
MSSFITAMDVLSNRAVGVNGSDIYTQPIGESQELLALFGALNRDLSRSTLKTLMETASQTATLEDLVSLAFHTRDILEGKGERDLFYNMFHILYKKAPSVVLNLVKLIPDYGAWFDLQKIIEAGIKNGDLSSAQFTSSTAYATFRNCDYVSAFKSDNLVDTIVTTYSEQLHKDNSPESKATLAAKWAPRENKHNGWLGGLIASKSFPSVRDHKERLKLYRKLLSSVNARIDTVERKMCHDADKQHHFADIEPGKVPSRCLKTKRKAFFNEDKAGTVRKPDDPDRMACREKFQTHMAKALKGEAKVHGKVLMPHEFIVELHSGRVATENDRTTLQAQWNDMRDGVLAKGTLGKTVVMCDFSGSMSGTPMDVSMGLGLLCAETTSPAFRDRIITFDSKPTWHNVSRFNGLFNRIDSFSGVSQGTSTNFQAAVDLVLDRLVEAKVPVGEEPDIILVITDMGWDQANANVGYGGPKVPKFETHIDRIKRDFGSRGGWKVPTIVIWNVSGKFQQYHHTSDTEGVCVISGWSPTILKYIMAGDDIVEKMKTMTPYKMMRAVLDDPRYDPVRAAISVKDI